MHPYRYAYILLDNVMKFIIKSAYIVFGIKMMVIGVALIVLAFFNSPVALQFGMGLGGLGFISLGLLVLKRNSDRKREEEQAEQIMANLDEIKQELEKLEQPKGTGVAIADVISSGLKYYTEHLSKEKDEE